MGKTNIFQKLIKKSSVHFTKRGKSLLFKFFIVFLSLVIIPVLISSYIIFYSSNNVLEKQMRESNITIMDNMINYVDERLLNINLGIAAFTTNNYLNYLLGDENYAANFPTTYIRIKEKLAEIKNLDDIVDEVLVYFIHSDTLISHEGLYNFEYYFNQVNKIGGKDADYWRSFLRKQNKFFITSTRKINKDLMLDDTKHVISIHTSMPLLSAPKATLVVFLKENIIKSIISNYANKENKNYAVIDKEGNIVTLSGDNDIINNIIINKSLEYSENNYQGSFRVKSEGGSSFVTYNSSSYSDWTYITAVPFSTITTQSKYIKIVMFYVLLIFIIAGFIISALLSRKMYKPIEALIDYLNELSESDENDINKTRVNDEYIFISNEFKRIHSANNVLKESINSAIPFLQENLLYRLLTIDISAEKDMLYELEKYNIKFPWEKFCILCVRIDFHNDDKGYKNNSSKDAIDMRGRIKSIIYAMLVQKYNCSVVEMDMYTLAFILNFNPNCDNNVINVCYKIIDFFNNEEYALRISIGVGSECNNITDIKESYEQAKKALTFRKVSIESQVIIFNEGMDSSNVLYDLSIQFKTLSHYLLGNEHEKTMETIKIILKELRGRKPGHEEINSISKLLIQTGISALEVKGVILKETSLSYKCIYEKIDEFEFIEEYEKHILNTYSSINMLMNNTGSKKKEEIVNAIINYINNNYYKDIYLEGIANEFNITSNYLSHFFKDHIGISFSEYLGRIRIEKTKKLLETTDKPVNEICTEVGYISVNSFIRTFRKFEGITPGKYRDIVQNKELNNENK